MTDTESILSNVERALRSQPIDALRAIVALRADLEALERDQVRRALERGGSYADIARPLGISRQAAHRRYRDLPADDTRRPSHLLPQAREVLLLARAEAERTGATTVDGVHVVLACVAAGHLRADGFTPKIPRRAVEAPPPARQQPRPSFRLSLLADLQRSQGPIGVDELLIAASENRAARRLLSHLRPSTPPALSATPSGASRLGP